MKRLKLFGIVMALGLILGWAGVAAAKVPVFVTILPQKYFVEQIAGDLADVNVLVPPGSEPHMYEPTPKQMTALAHAKGYFAIGVEVEDAWLPRVTGTNPDLKVFYTQAGVHKVPMASHHTNMDMGDHPRPPMDDPHGPGMGMTPPPPPHDPNGPGGPAPVAMHHHDEDEENGLDPHIWLDPVIVKTIARNTCNGLIVVDPANAATYEANLKKFLNDLDQIDGIIREMLASLPPDHRTFLVFHPAWGYFAERYGLHQMAVEEEGKEPGPRQLQDLVEHCRENNIHTVFVQPEFSQKSARVIADELGGKVQALDPLAPDWKANLLSAARALKESVH